MMDKIDNTINGSSISKGKIDNLNSWVFNHLQVVNSPLTNDHVNIKDNTTSGVIKKQKLLIQISIRDLNNDLIKFP